MKNGRLKNLFVVIILILIVIGIPYLLYNAGTLIEIDYFGYVNNWWIVLLYLFLLVAIFILRRIDIEKYISYFLWLFFTIPFFILGISFGEKPKTGLKSYDLLLDKEQEIDSLTSTQFRLENDLLQLKDKSLEEQATQNPSFKNHEVIFFERGSSRLSSFNKRKITAFLSTLENCKLNIKGYADGSGTKATNMSISNKRAQKVADFIKSTNQETNIINMVNGFGDDDKLVRNRDEMSRSKNRRVTIEIAGKTDEDAKALRKNIQDEIDRNKADIKNKKRERDSLRRVIYQKLEG